MRGKGRKTSRRTCACSSACNLLYFSHGEVMLRSWVQEPLYCQFINQIPPISCGQRQASALECCSETSALAAHGKFCVEQCSFFVSGSKSNDSLSPDYVPTLFNHSTTREKNRAEQNLASYSRRLESCKRRSETAATRGAIPSSKVSRTKEEHEAELESPENEKGTMTEPTRTSDASTTTDLTASKIIEGNAEYIDALEKNLCRLRVENADLRDRAVVSEVKRCIP